MTGQEEGASRGRGKDKTQLLEEEVWNTRRRLPEEASEEPRGYFPRGLRQYWLSGKLWERTREGEVCVWGVRCKVVRLMR